MNLDASPANGWVNLQRRIIDGDTNTMGVIYYGNYLRFFDMGCNEYLRARGGDALDVEESGILLPVIEVGGHYRAPARYHDRIHIATRLERLERVRVRFGCCLVRQTDEALLVTGFTTHPVVDAHTRRAVRLPGALRAFLRSGR